MLWKLPPGRAGSSVHAMFSPAAQCFRYKAEKLEIRKDESCLSEITGIVRLLNSAELLPSEF